MPGKKGYDIFDIKTGSDQGKATAKELDDASEDAFGSKEDLGLKY